MNSLFHEDVDENFVEFFIIDLYKNYESLIELARHHTDSLPALKREIEDCVSTIFSILEEESEMLRRLVEFRTITLAEHKKLKEIIKMRKTDEIEYIVSCGDFG